jgi:hypothetical protein
VYNENYEKEKTLQVVDSVPPSFLNLSVDLSVESPYGITKVKNSHGFRHGPASVVNPDPIRIRIRTGSLFNGSTGGQKVNKALG